MCYMAGRVYRLNIVAFDIIEGSIAADRHDPARAVGDAAQATEGGVFHIEGSAAVAEEAGALVEARGGRKQIGTSGGRRQRAAGRR